MFGVHSPLPVTWYRRSLSLSRVSEDWSGNTVSNTGGVEGVPTEVVFDIQEDEATHEDRDDEEGGGEE